MYIIKRKIHKKIEKYKISIFKIKLQQEQTKQLHDEQERKKYKYVILKLKFKLKKGRSSVLNSAKKISQIDEKYKYRAQKNSYQDLDIYNPFQTPPNFIKAQRHHQATSIGVPQIQTGSLKDMQVCPCCQNLINKQPISICCDEDELLFLGVGYPLYYRLTKYIVLIVLFVFIVSGSGLYYLMTVDCRQQCISFYGLMIIDFQLQQSESNRVQIMNMITAIGIFIFGLYIKSLINKDISVLQSKVICPSQYTVMLQNLPKDYEQYELKNWIKQKFGYSCILINIGYNVQELQSSYQKRNTLTIQLNKLYIKRQRTLKQQKSKNNHMNSSNKLSLKLINPEDKYQYEKERQLITQIQKLDQIINNYQNNLINIDKNGTAFVTFQNAETVQQIIQKYQQTQILGFFTRTLSKLLRVNALQFKGKIVKVSRAPAPRQVIWQNLQYSHFKSFTFQIFFMISMFLLIYFAFQYQFKFSAYAYRLRTEGKRQNNILGKQSGQQLIVFQSIIISLIVVILNSILRIMILIFTKLKKYHSYTQQQSSFCFYYTLMYLFNSCFMIYIVHGQYPSQSNQLLLYDIHFVMLANAFSQPLFKLFDPIMWYKIIFKKYLKSLKPQRNPYTQMYIHKYYEGHQIQNGDNYQYIARILIVSIWFAHAAPLGVVFCLIGIVIDYWIGKIMLLRVYKKPQNISKSIARFIINSIQLLPLIYICGVLQFTYKSTYSSQQQTDIQRNVFNHKNISIVQFLMNFFNYSITISVLIICILGYLIFFKTQLINKKYFGFNYETQNPITKFRGQINYIQTVLKTIKKGSWLNVRSKQDMQIINQLTNISQSPNGINKIKRDVAKLKIKMASSKQNDDQDDNQIQLNDMSDKIRGQDQLRQSLLSSVQQKKPQKQKQINKNKFILRRTRSIFV